MSRLRSAASARQVLRVLVLGVSSHLAISTGFRFVSFVSLMLCGCSASLRCAVQIVFAVSSAMQGPFEAIQGGDCPGLRTLYSSGLLTELPCLQSVDFCPSAVEGLCSLS